MGFLSDFFLGSRPDMRLPGYLEGLIGQIGGLNVGGIGYSGHEYKRMAKQYNRDPASLAGVSKQQGAVERRQIGEDYMTGANAMIGAAGGEQANLLQHMKQNALDKSDERTGMNSYNEANQKYFGALSGFNQAYEAANQRELAKYGLMGQLMVGGGYDATRKGGLFNPQTIAGAVQAFAGGAGAAMGH